MAKDIDFNTALPTSLKSDDKLLPELVAERITQMIVDDSYGSGHKLPNEYVLAERLGVGRSTVREAIKILASQNVLEVRRGSGTYVSESIGMVEDPLGFRFCRSKKKLAVDLCELRIMLEPRIAAAAAANINARQKEELVRLKGKIAELLDSDRDHGAVDAEFHKKIAEASGNLVAPGLVGILTMAIPLFVRVSGSSLKDEIISTHEKIVDAIARHDRDGAEETMREHLQYIQRFFQSLLDDF